MHDACVMSDVHVCTKCQKYAESSTAVVVKPTCAKIYLWSRADRVAATAAPNRITWYLLHPAGPKVFNKCVCRKCQKDVESSMVVVVKPTCAKIYLRSRVDRVAATAAPNGITWYLLHPAGPKVFNKCVQKVPERCKKLDGRCCKTYLCKNLFAEPGRPSVATIHPASEEASSMDGWRDGFRGCFTPPAQKF